MKVKNPVVASELRFADSTEMAVGRNGELNASSKKDLIQQQLKLLNVAATGGAVTEEDYNAKRVLAKKHQELVHAAFNDPKVHKEVGEVLVTNLYQAANRRGFARKFLGRQELVQGQFPVAKLRRKDVTAVYATSPSKVESQIIRDKTFFPPEFMIEVRPFIEQREINTSSGDVLEEKYMEAMEGIMVAEDRIWYSLANQTVGIDNVLQVISSNLAPITLMEVKTQAARWDLPVPNLLMANDIYNDIVGQSDFIQAIEPVARHELIMTGELAVLYGMAITSDAYRHPEHRVLAPGEFFAISSPETHGQYTDRGGIDTEVITGAVAQQAGRGWWMYESFSCAIANSRSVSKGYRVTTG